MACATLYARRMGVPIRRILIGDADGGGKWLQELSEGGGGGAGWGGGLERIVYEVPPPCSPPREIPAPPPASAVRLEMKHRVSVYWGSRGLD